MIKKTLYPKTRRIGNSKVVVTEKIDGSNLGFFKFDNELIIAQRNNVYKLSELEEVKGMVYKGLYQWLKDNGEQLKGSLHHSSGLFGEWIGMGKLSYVNTLDKRFYMFAKANIDAQLNVSNLVWDIQAFVYPFINLEVPNYIGLVPVVHTSNNLLSIEELNELYNKYTNQVGRDVEGFVVKIGSEIQKYVRMKNGSLEPHKS